MPAAKTTDPEKMERLLPVPGTTDVIRVSVELDAEGTDTTSFGVSRTVAGRVMTARVVATSDERLFVLARAVCVTGTPVGDRTAVLALAHYAEAWYRDFAGPMLLLALNNFANSAVQS